MKEPIMTPGQIQWMWCCTNCRATRPEGKTPGRKRNPEGLTSAQVQAVEKIRMKIVQYHSFGHPEAYEFKAFKVENTGTLEHPFITVSTEYGRRTDEGTMASVFCRDSRLFWVKDSGKIVLLGGQQIEGEAAFYRQTP